jgi:hypothetical protein
MRAYAQWAFRIVIAQAPTNNFLHSECRDKPKNGTEPLVEAVVAHKMYTGQIEVSTALRALCGVEQPRMVRI